MATKPNSEYEVAFAQFIAGLTELSKQTGITIDVCGGVSYSNPQEIRDIEYSDDPTSGDIQCCVSQSAFKAL